MDGVEGSGTPLLTHDDNIWYLPLVNPYSSLGPGKRATIARRLQLSRNHVNRVIEGKVGVSLEIAHAIAKAAGVTLDELWAYRQRQVKQRGRELRQAISEAKRARESQERRSQEEP